MPFGVGGTVLFTAIPFVNFLLYFVFPFGIMTSQRTGKANTARHCPLKAETGRRKPQQSTSSASASLWEREARDGRKRGNGENRPRRDGGTEKRLKRRPKRKAHRSDGGRADQQGPRLRHKDRAVKRDEIRISTSGRSVDFLTIHRPA